MATDHRAADQVRHAAYSSVSVANPSVPGRNDVDVDMASGERRAHGERLQQPVGQQKGAKPKCQHFFPMSLE